MDLLTLAEVDTTLKKSGNWWIGPCPFCGGRDRFNLTLGTDGYRWFCRHCGEGKYGDIIDYIRRRDNVGYREAKATIDGNQPAAPHKAPPAQEIERTVIPNDAWQSTGKQFVADCQQYLWGTVGAKALAWLQARGLTDATLERYCIGYNPLDRKMSSAEWGIEGMDGAVAAPRGIVIPCISETGSLYYIKFRIPAGQKKYQQIRGGRPAMFGHPNTRGSWLVVVTEGEFDCMVLDQQAGNICSVCTFGGVTSSPDNVDITLMTWLHKATHVAVCYDNDEQGRDGAAKLLPAMNAVQFELPEQYHDINDAHLAGLDLSLWVKGEVERTGIVQADETTMDIFS